MSLSLTNMPNYHQWGRPIGVVLCFVVSAVALAAAPVLLPGDYHWVAHTTSEAAAQRLDGAWLARSGFLLFGLGVIWLATRAREQWGTWGTILHTSFGVLMIAAGVFSARSWNPALPFDRIENLFHSVAATAMGFAFACGVVAVLALRARRAMTVRWLDVVAIAASILIPLAMSVRNDIAGLLQRGMFVIAYAWYGREAVLALWIGDRH